MYIILMSSVVHTAISRPDGAPSEACNKLKPRHGRVEQEWKPGLINLTISGTNSPNDTMATYVPGKLYTGLWDCGSPTQVHSACVSHYIHVQYKANAIY